MRTIFRVQRGRIEDMAIARMGCVEADDLLMELVNLFVGARAEGEVVQAWIGLVVRGGLIAGRDANH